MNTDLTEAETKFANAWLTKHGVLISPLPRMLAVRLGARDVKPSRLVLNRWRAGGFLIGLLLAVAYHCLQYLPNVRGVEMTESQGVYFIIGGTVVGFWLSIRGRERDLGGLPVSASVERPSWSKHLGGWYLASLVITFAGGTALAVAMYVTTSARTYAWSWLGALAWGALCTAVILVGTWRAPVIADDPASASVDAMLRVEDSFLAMPGYFAVLVLIDLVTTHRQPPEFTWWLLGYAVLAFGTSAISALTYWRRVSPRAATPNGPN
ncbi:hypothetical protein SAMN05421504_1021137 [Amycolatopsis xylanica]|uniref:Uncharacterized protein n=1 Tax=Amycolatopsis xylanica TaxID=589385 RepID=A0A1H3B2D5_9PSEU|nr:hypothetical protein [Amycolatopsis xylanica]SDX35564.1 hypothetical protein SAMN05421504_1021137 [Amycolatopsis xylanica]